MFRPIPKDRNGRRLKLHDIVLVTYKTDSGNLLGYVGTITGLRPFQMLAKGVMEMNVQFEDSPETHDMMSSSTERLPKRRKAREQILMLHKLAGIDIR